MSDTALPAPADPAGGPSARPAPTRGLTVLAVCIALEGVALVVLGLLVLGSLLAGAGGNTLLFLSLVALFGLYGGVLLLAARATLRRRRWARSLGVLSQALALLMSPTIIGAGVWAAGIPLLVIAAVALVLVLAPPVGGLLKEDSATDTLGTV